MLSTNDSGPGVVGSFAASPASAAVWGRPAEERICGASICVPSSSVTPRVFPPPLPSETERIACTP